MPNYTYKNLITNEIKVFQVPSDKRDEPLTKEILEKNEYEDFEHIEAWERQRDAPGFGYNRGDSSRLMQNLEKGIFDDKGDNKLGL